METLQLKDLACFLSGLKAIKNVNDENELVEIDGVVDDFNYDTKFLFYRNGKASGNYDVKYFKPILRPLDLSKTITVEGKEIVPLVELAKVLQPSFEWEYDDREFRARTTNVKPTYYFECDEDGFSFYDNQSHCATRNQLTLFKKLYEWKFDVEGLIGRGLAVSVYDLPENPYI